MPSKQKEKNENVRKYRRRPSAEEAEQYAAVISAFRGFLQLTAIDDDLHIRGTRSKIPQDPAQLAEWCRSLEHLDAAAGAIRRTMGVYLPASRIFAMQDNIRKVDYDVVADFMDNSLDSLRHAISLIEIDDRKHKRREILQDLEAAYLQIREIRDFAFIGVMPDSDFNEGSPFYLARRSGTYPAERAAVSAASRRSLPEAEASDQEQKDE